MKIFKRFLVLTALLVVVLSLAACNDDNDDTDVVTLTFWHTYSEGEAAIFDEQVIPAFEAAYPNIKIESVRMPYDGLKQQVIAGAIGDAGPDVMRMDIIWVPEFARLGALEKLDDYAGFDTLKDEFFSGPLSTNFYDGSYYGVPLNTNTKVGIFNNALMTELGIDTPPTTFDDLLTYKDQLDEGEYLIGVSGTGTWGMLPYFWSLGGSITDDAFTTATGYINSQASIDALETLKLWYDQGIIGPSVLGEQPDTWGGMSNGNYLLIDDGPWYYSIMGDSAVNSTTPTSLPAGDAGSISIVGGENLVMLGNSEHKDAAWTFMQYMSTMEPQILMAQAGMIPTLTAAANDEDALTAPYIAAYFEQLESTNPRTPNPNWAQIDEAVSLAFESVFREEKTATEALNDIAAQIDALLVIPE